MLVIVWLFALILPFSCGGGDDNNNEPLLNDQPHMPSRIVHTKYGSVSGTIVQLEGRSLEPVEVFKGIPYASPPTGSLRFMPPVSAAIWSGVRKADR
jgi:Carboxylesterase family